MNKIFVIDGTDGSGKQTQLEKLCEAFDRENIEYAKFSFPRYDNPSSSLVKMYLGGEFGTDAQAISPYTASTFYALDRYACYMQEMKAAIESGKVIILDRYTTANMVHQAGKIKDIEERDKFLDWLYNFEFKDLGLPIPTEVFFLDMPIEKSEELMKNRLNKINNETQKDIHESNKEHLEAAYDAGMYVAKKYNWNHIKCCDEENNIRTIENIHSEIYNEIKKYL
ncbi:MAG: thymidylate kinase [Clostridia bacterium]|nr:thymidylate kinase [Clostridia bacterium]